MFRVETLILMSIFAFAVNALAADNAALVNRTVRIEVPGVTGGVIGGKLIGIEGCLYVQFDQKTKEGFTSVRLDQVRTLQFLGGAGPTLDAMRRQEPKKCFAEANG